MNSLRLTTIAISFLSFLSCSDLKDKQVQEDGHTHSFHTKDGKKQGLYYIINNSNDTLVEANYKNDLLEGNKIFFDSIGNRKREVFYSNGKRNGISKDYFSSGKVKNIANFKDDLAHGDWLQFNKDGDTLKYYQYANDTLKYYKAFDGQGDYYDSYLSITFNNQLNDSLEIIVDKLSANGNSIGVLIGDLNHKTFVLEDTFHIKSSRGNKLEIHKDLISSDTIEGLIFEIDADRDKFLADYYFIYDKRNKRNLTKKIIDFKEFKNN